ncbi:ParA family protein [Eleftheria terrae]|uniref:ParA family protein n=1 Tax=Eleftheria terrae TaxID=1597781 RepID=UPI00263B43E9|nr:ParA family protein [Eleftheria terrae]WKB50530.1 ParA family protein [Eleftheria terrae]
MTTTAPTVTDAVKAAVILAITNMKGGVGKSTTTINLAKYIAQFSKQKVLVVDIDAQGNSTATFLSAVPKDALVGSDLFKAELPEGRLPAVASERVHVIAGDRLLKSVDGMVASDNAAARRALYQRFRANLRAVAQGYDVVIIDTPTTAEHRYFSAMVAADFSVTPALMDAFSLSGARDLVQALHDTKALYGNPRHKHVGILPNQFSKRSRLHQSSLEKITSAGIKVVPFQLNHRPAVQDAIDARRAVWEGDSEGRVNRAAGSEWKSACKAILAEVLQ